MPSPDERKSGEARTLKQTNSYVDLRRISSRVDLISLMRRNEPKTTSLHTDTSQKSFVLPRVSMAMDFGASSSPPIEKSVITHTNDYKSIQRPCDET